MPEVPNAHPGAPLTVWLRPRTARDPDGPVLPGQGWYQTLLSDEPTAVEYVRKDMCDAWLTEASRRDYMKPDLVRAPLQAALEALEDNDADGAERILRTCLERL